MRKILTGFLGLVLVATVLVGTGYALFSSTATASGITFATGNAELKLGTNGTNYYQDYNFGNAFFKNLYPTQNTLGQQFLLKNTSTSAIALSLATKLNSGAAESVLGSWNALKDVVNVGFDYYDGTIWHTAGTATLNQWLTNGYPLEGGNLAFGDQRWYRMHVVVNNAGNEIATKGLTSAVFTFTGTQAP